MRTKLIIITLLILSTYLRIDGCTVFSIVEGENVYVGNNEDWYIPYPKYRVIPGSDATYGRIIFSYNNNWGQGGMNEKGLFFDWILSPEESMTWKQDSLKKDIVGNLSEKILSKCSSVDEALKFYEEYNEPIFKTSYIVLVDTTGQTAFVSWEESKLMVNRCKGVCVAGYGGNKFVEKHKELDGVINKDELVQLLDAGHQEGAYPTLYSNIYDLKNGLIHLYYFHNYEEELTIDLQEEIKKGVHSVELAEAFKAKIPRGEFNKLQKKYLLEEVKTIPLKGWLVVFSLLSIAALSLVVLFKMFKKKLNSKKKSIANKS